MLVKICGITNETDALTAINFNADFIGMIFVPASKRYLTIEQAKKIRSAIGDKSKVVGLFQNESISAIVKIVNELNIKIVQLHGQESLEYVKKLSIELPDCKFIKAINVKNADDLNQIRIFNDSDISEKILAFILDGPAGGGTGIAFDWQNISNELKKIRIDEKEKNIRPLIFLAGGLTPENVKQAIKIISPDGVDVSSGVEAKPGIKDPEKIEKFTSLARQN